MRHWMVWILLVATVLALAAAGQVTRDEFDALAKQVRALEGKVTLLEIQNKRQEQAINDLKARLLSVQQLAQTSKPAGAVANPRIVDLAQLLRFNANTPAQLLGSEIFGTIRICRVGPSADTPGATRVLGQSVQLHGDFVFCQFDMKSRQAMGMETDEWYRIRGTVTQATIVRSMPGRTTVPSLLVSVDNVEAVYRRTPSSFVTGTFNVR